MFSINPLVKEKWYVIFEHSGKKRWHHRYLKTGFHHCYAMKKSEADLFWIVVNPRWSHIEIDYRLVDTFPEVRDYAGDYCEIVEYTTSIDPTKCSTQPAILSCVDILKRQLGIVAWSVLTPYQLYKHLERSNG